MKKLGWILFAIAAFLVYACASRGYRTHPQPGRETVYVYTFAAPAVGSVDDSRKLITQFLGRGAGQLHRSDENIVYYTSDSDVTETFENDLNNGNFTFNKSMQRYGGTSVPALPTQEEAVRIAERFLDQNGLTPANRKELHIAHLGGLRANAVIDGRKAGPVIDKLLTVTYGRTVDDLPVIGPGSKVVVHVGDRGEVVGAIYRWRELQSASRTELSSEELISAAEAERLAKGQIRAEFGEGASFKLLRSGRAYYDNNGKILQPVYVFETEISLRDEKTKPFPYLCVIQALRNSPEPLRLTLLDPRAKKQIQTIKPGYKPQQLDKTSGD